MSWQNLVLYSAATPQYDDEKPDDGVKDINWDKLDASNPDNPYFKDNTINTK